MAIINGYTPKHRATKYVKQKVTELKVNPQLYLDTSTPFSEQLVEQLVRISRM